MIARNFKAQPLTGEMALQAYPLIQVTRGDLSLDEWKDFVRAQTGFSVGTRQEAPVDGRGIIALVNAKGYLQGLYSYEVRSKTGDASVLEVENVVALDLFRPAAAAEALHRSMHEMACRFACNTVHVVVADGDSWLKGYFDGRGYQFEQIHFCQPLPPP